MLGRTVAALGLVAALFTSSAHAAVIQDLSGLASATNGIALGPDGNFWVSEEFNDSVVRMTPGGAVLDRYPVGDGPTSVATGPGGRVWVAVTGANQFVWFDATAATPTAHPVPTGQPCGPVAIVAGGDGRMYFSLPNCAAPQLGTMAADGSDLQTDLGLGKVFDLEAYNGKLYAPDFDGDVVRRIGLGATLTPEASIGAPGMPDGITADGAGNLWVTLFGSGHVGQFAATQNAGAVTDITPTGGTLTGAFGIVAGADGRIYVTGKDSGNLARVNADGSFRFYPTNSQPFQIVNGPDGDLYFTDRASTRVQRFLSTAPRATTAAAVAAAQTVGSATATVDPRGNETQVVFDYGPTAAYGSTSAPISVPAGAGGGGVPVTAVLSGLAVGTTYHVRVRAINEEGSAAGADTTFTTWPPVTTCGVVAIRLAAAERKRCTFAPQPTRLAARVTFSWAFIGSRTALRKVDIAGLTGGETAKVTCSGKGCPFKSNTYKHVKKGKKALGSRFGLKRKLAKGAKIEVRVTKPGAIGTSALVTIRGRKQDPKIVRSCLLPGAKKTSRCS